MIRLAEHQKRMELYNQGLNDTEMSRRLYISPESVRYWRKINNLESNNPNRKATEEVQKKMLELWKEGLSDGQIAKKLGLSKWPVKDWRKKNHIPANFRAGGVKNVGTVH